MGEEMISVEAKTSDPGIRREAGSEVIGRASRHISEIPLPFACDMWRRIQEAMRGLPSGVVVIIRRWP